MLLDIGTLIRVQLFGAQRGKIMKKIVSLTSFGSRINLTLPKALDSIQKQLDFKPDCIMLYLTDSDFSTFNKERFKDIDNLEVQSVPDYKSYKKYFALADKRFNKDLVWIIDDDSLYCDYDYNSFVEAYGKHKDNEAIYAFNVWQVNNFEDNFYNNKVSKAGLVKKRFVLGDNKFIMPNVMRIDEEFIADAFKISPTCDDTFFSAYIQKQKTNVYQIELPEGMTRNFIQLDVPKNSIKLIDINKPIIKANLKRNFEYFNLI